MFGCGPGNATRDLALSFKAAVGVDPGSEMIRAAQGLGGLTMTDQPISYHVASAENCASAPGTEDGVDLLTAAMAVRTHISGFLPIASNRNNRPIGSRCLSSGQKQPRLSNLVEQ